MSELSILSETLDKLSPESLYDYCQISEEDVQKIRQEVNPQYLVILNHKREGSVIACLHILDLLQYQFVIKLRMFELKFLHSFVIQLITHQTEVHGQSLLK
mgnify:CR=1 FL=1